MAEKGIIFSTEMVKAVLDGKKTQTRRVIKGADTNWEFCNLNNNAAMTKVNKSGEEYPKEVDGLWATFEREGNPQFPMFKSKYQPGDILYVKEKWRTHCNFDGEYCYYADDHVCKDDGCKWKSPMFMPRAAARILLRVERVGGERLQDISANDCIAEGICPPPYYKPEYTTYEIMPMTCNALKGEYARVWNKINGKKDGGAYLWVNNPWVWVYEFKLSNNACHMPTNRHLKKGRAMY